MQQVQRDSSTLLHDYVQSNVETGSVRTIEVLLFGKFNAICLTWIEKIEKRVRKSPASFTAKLLPKHRVYDPTDPKSLEGVLLIDKQAMEILTQIFKERYGVNCTIKGVFGKGYVSNSLSNLLPKADVFDVEFTWTPNNPHLYPEQTFTDIASLTPYKSAILSYLKNSLVKNLTSEAEQFVPVLATQIKEVLDSWLLHIKKGIENSPESYTLQLLPTDRIYDILDPRDLKGTLLVDRQAMELLTKIFGELYEMHCEISKDVCWCEHAANSLLDVLPKAGVYDVRFAWTPTNPHIFSSIPSFPDIEILSPFKSAILAYLEGSLTPPLAARAEEFVPLLTKRIYDTILSWEKHFKSEAAKFPKAITLLPKKKIYDILDPDNLKGTLLVDRKGMELLTTIFREVYNIDCVISRDVSDMEYAQNSLLDLLPKAGVYDVTFSQKTL